VWRRVRGTQHHAPRELAPRELAAAELRQQRQPVAQASRRGRGEQRGAAVSGGGGRQRRGPGGAWGGPKRQRPLRSGTQQALSVTQRDINISVTQRALGVTQRALSVTQRALGVTQRALSVTQRALGVTQRALNVTQRALGVTQRALGVTQRALNQRGRCVSRRARSDVTGRGMAHTRNVVHLGHSWRGLQRSQLQNLHAPPRTQWRWLSHVAHRYLHGCLLTDCLLGDTYWILFGTHQPVSRCAPLVDERFGAAATAELSGSSGQRLQRSGWAVRHLRHPQRHHASVRQGFVVAPLIRGRAKCPPRTPRLDWVGVWKEQRKFGGACLAPKPP
jgi:hypothetical protein